MLYTWAMTVLIAFGLALVLFIGLLTEVKADWYGNIELSHISSPHIDESGYGLNTLFIDIGYRSRGFYIAGGLGFHHEKYDCPEVCFGDNELARLKVGWEFDL